MRSRTEPDRHHRARPCPRKIADPLCSSSRSTFIKTDARCVSGGRGESFDIRLLVYGNHDLAAKGKVTRATEFVDEETLSVESSQSGVF